MYKFDKLFFKIQNISQETIPGRNSWDKNMSIFGLKAAAQKKLPLKLAALKVLLLKHETLWVVAQKNVPLKLAALKVLLLKREVLEVVAQKNVPLKLAALNVLPLKHEVLEGFAKKVVSMMLLKVFFSFQ